MKFVNEIEDILYGLENYSELRPTKKRIDALEKVNKDNKKVISDMVQIFKEGHGVLSNKKRISCLKDVFGRIK